MRLFGTDGIRGVYGKDLTDATAYAVGKSLVKYYSAKKILVAKDSRLSSTDLEHSLSGGIKNQECEVFSVGIMPTPCCAYLVKKYGFDCGAVISASHNPPQYNGIKVFNADGDKITSTDSALLENIIVYELDKLSAKQADKFCPPTLQNAELDYIEYLTQDCDLSGITVAVDCGYGAGSVLTGKVFDAAGATVFTINDGYDGEKINSGCGALYPNMLCRRMECGDIRADIGFCLDGDADRLAVIYDNEILDGDSVLYNLALMFKPKTVVGTIMCNSALEKALKRRRISFVVTDVGDANVADKMRKTGSTVGGEPSGHYIIRDSIATGDAIKAAVTLCKVIKKGGNIKRLKLYPQKTVNLPLHTENNQDFKNIIECFKNNGKITVRKSGTEPLLRVTAECKEQKTLNKILDQLKQFM